MILFFVRGRGNRFLRYKKVLTQASSQCNIKVMSTRARFYRVVVFFVDPLLICSNIYIYIYVSVLFCFVLLFVCFFVLVLSFLKYVLLYLSSFIVCLS